MIWTALTFSQKDYEQAYKLLYTHDQSQTPTAQWAYNLALTTFAQHGETEQARQAPANAFEVNPHVPNMLMDAMTGSVPSVGTYRIGDEDEARLYARDNHDLWASIPKSLGWFGDQLPRHFELAEDGLLPLNV